MVDATNFRRERIEKLLYELKYEIERGILQEEIDETILFQFLIPISRSIPDGIIHCQFSSRPMPPYGLTREDFQPRLKLVK